LITIKNLVTPGIYTLEEIFIGLKPSKVLLDVFKTQKEVDDVFAKTKVIVEKKDHYMSVKNDDATIMVGLNHLQDADPKILYLDIVHELVHVKQQRAGKNLYDKSYCYVDRPTEIEAYDITVKEAKRLGMSNKEIIDYLKVEWITAEEHKKLAAHVGIAF